MRKVAIIGSTTWGTALGIVMASKGKEVSIWTRTEEEARKINSECQNPTHLPGIILPENIKATASPSQALQEAELTMLAVPSQSMRENLRVIKHHLWNSTLILSLSKGIELETSKRMSEVIAEELEPNFKDRIVVLSGPNFAREILQGLPTATMIASENFQAARIVQKEISSVNLKAYIAEDVIGVELGGALKNVIALSVGMSDGLGYKNNTRAILITLGLAEIVRLGIAAGANPLTFWGLAGIGDLIATCAGELSRNYLVGIELAKGKKLKEALASINHVAEGVDTTAAALGLAQKLKVEMPIAEQVYKVLFEGLEPEKAISSLMEREPKPELPYTITFKAEDRTPKVAGTSPTSSPSA